MTVTTHDLLDLLGIAKELTLILTPSAERSKVLTMIDTMLASVDSRLIAEQLTPED